VKIKNYAESSVVENVIAVGRQQPTRKKFRKRGGNENCRHVDEDKQTKDKLATSREYFLDFVSKSSQE